VNLLLAALFISACFLAYSNGANDNFKGVATLFGSQTTGYRSAITWATCTTLLGSVAAIFLASSLAKNFSGKGLVPDELLLAPAFAVSIAFSAGLTVFLATRIGMPVSTTHALVGALFGAGVVAAGDQMNFARLGETFLIPLIVSPLIATLLSTIAYIILRRLRVAFGDTKKTCVCVGPKKADAPSSTPVTVADEQECVEIYQGNFVGINAQKLLDVMHYLSAGIVSFARGLNDTPKIVGLLMVVNQLQIEWGMIAVAIAMAVGGLVSARRVGETIAQGITPMNHGQGFTANLITGLLVTTASVHGLPVSTTHVSVGSIFGIGLIIGETDSKVVCKILISWMLTLPVATICAAAIYWALSHLL
jgi:PiT family inorganic phosphate transporter